MSPRRSSRARSSQNAPPAPPHTNSSSSIATTTKDSRNPRIINTNTRTASPGRRASTVRSESIDDADSASRTADGAPGPRRSRRGEVENTKKEPAAAENGNEEAEDPQEEDVTRCICGRPEYPGPGASVKEQLPSNTPISDEVGNFFVQCDKCHVWQHGGCMGLTDESMLPDEYYCEICKPELHRVIKSLNGLRSSRYLPVLEGAISDGSSPLSSAGELSRKNSTKSKTSDSTKRRATMNSRGAYDEDEMLRRAIEESREMGTLKRSRDDVEDLNPIVKRQRTGSSSASSISRPSLTPPPPVEDSSVKSVANGVKSSNSTANGSGISGSKLRGSAAKNSREKEMRDKQKEALASQRAEAASKRNARSERRRGEDSPPPTPSLSPSKSNANNVKLTRNVKDATPPAKSSASRKGGRPPARRGRLGRNQYTRDLPLNGDTSDSPLRDTSRDAHAVDSPRPLTNGNGHKDNINGESGRSSKAKTHPARTSMNEMKRRVAAIFEFVGRMQNERGAGMNSKSTSDPASGNGGGRSRSSGSGSSSFKGNSTPNGSASANANLTAAGLIKAVTEGLEGAGQKRESNSSSSGDGRTKSEDLGDVNVELVPQKSFEQMNSIEMMETLKGELSKWQDVWGVYAR